MIETEATTLDGVVIIKPRVFDDPRGYFFETYKASDMKAAGLPQTFVQDNHSRSQHGVLRGLHFQTPQWQGKLVRVTAGEIFDVAVDIRPKSKTYGQWVGVTLSAENKQQLYVPEGFAHGFCVLSDGADVLYKCTTEYKPSDDRCLLWNDPVIGIDWPIPQPLVSDKDRQGMSFLELKSQ